MVVMRLVRSSSVWSMAESCALGSGSGIGPANHFQAWSERPVASTPVLTRLDLRGITSGLGARLPAPEVDHAGPVAVVREVLTAVRERGDAAVRELTERFDGVVIDDLRVPDAERKAALESIEPAVREALEVASAGVLDFHRHALASTASPSTYERHEGSGVVRVDTVFRPVDRAGVYVPGGRARYPSSVIHTAGLAKVAGVPQVVLCCPPGPDGAIPQVTLAAAEVIGVDEVYRVGGAQAVALMAFGTESCRPVDVIAGPGNVYVATAQREVAGSGLVGVPSAFAGPSEIVVIADETASAELVAVDLILQAEHGPLGQSWVVTWSERFAEQVVAEVEAQVAVAPRREDIESTFAAGGFVVLVDGPEQAAEVTNLVAPEHLEIVTAEPAALVPSIRHAGAIFCGRWTPSSVGDYVAGPSHVLPTARTARFGSALSVRDFLKEVHVVTLDQAALAAVGPAVEALATAEGLIAHADSVARRRA
jgi:histidinol dehydrogenase